MNGYPDPDVRSDGRTGQSRPGTMESTREQAREMAEQIEERARASGQEMRQRLEAKGEEQKARAADTAEALADAVRSASTTLRDRHEDRLGQFTDEFADQLERFSGYLRDHDMRGLLHNLEDMARRNPAAFLGSTLAAGLATGRFLRSSSPGDETHGGGTPSASAPSRPPSHLEFASNSPTPELHRPREAADSSSPTAESISRRDSTYTAGGPTS